MFSRLLLIYSILVISGCASEVSRTLISERVKNRIERCETGHIYHVTTYRTYDIRFSDQSVLRKKYREIQSTDYGCELF